MATRCCCLLVATHSVPVEPSRTLNRACSGGRSVSHTSKRLDRKWHERIRHCLEEAVQRREQHGAVSPQDRIHFWIVVDFHEPKLHPNAYGPAAPIHAPSALCLHTVMAARKLEVACGLEAVGSCTLFDWSTMKSSDRSIKLARLLAASAFIVRLPITLSDATTCLCTYGSARTDCSLRVTVILLLHHAPSRCNHHPTQASHHSQARKHGVCTPRAHTQSTHVSLRMAIAAPNQPKRRCGRSRHLLEPSLAPLVSVYADDAPPISATCERGARRNALPPGPAVRTPRTGAAFARIASACHGGCGLQGCRTARSPLLPSDSPWLSI